MLTARTRTLVVLAATATMVFGGAAAAQAHVHVIPDSTAAGSYTKLTFRVPNESESASTTKVAVSLPTGTPLADVSAQALTGWTVAIADGDLPKPVTVEGTTLTKAPTMVTWTASAGADIGPGEFQEFSLSAGPIPADAKELAFPVAQTYSDGKVVNWNQPQAAGADEPEYPLPSFAVTAAVAGEHGDDDEAAAPSPSSAAPAASSAAGDSGSDGGGSDGSGVAIGLGAAGLVAGLAGLVLGGAAFRRSRPAATA